LREVRSSKVSESLLGTAHGDELKPVYARRSKRDDERTVTAASKAALALKIAAEEADGWRVVKANKKSVRVAKQKPVDRQLEDDAWCLLYRLGFKELNVDRTYSVQVGPKTPPRQLDVFAKDDETVFIIECTHSRETGPKSVKSLLDKIAAIREDVAKAVHQHYGREPRLKVKFGIATRNMEWREAFTDHSYLANAGRALNYSIEDYPVRIVALDSTVPGEHHGAVDKAGIEWLADTLSEDSTRPTIVMLHHRPVVCGIPYLDRYMCREAEALGAVLGKFPTVEHILCG
jgi:hypothetical protein